MKKILKILLAVLLALVLLPAACSMSDSEIKKPSGSGSDAAEVVTIAETVLYESGGIKVTATGYEDGWMGPEIKLAVENNSSKNVLLTVKHLSVNGYMMPYANLYAEVAAGKKANDSISILSSELKQSGIDVVADLQFQIQVSSADTWETLTTSDLISLSTSAAGHVQNVDDSGDVLYENKGIRVVCKGLKQDLIWDGTIVFYMENSCGKTVSIYAENVSVNGYMQDVSLWSELRNGTRVIDGMSLLDLSDLNLESIDDVKNIEFNLRIVNADTWDEIATTGVLKLNFG